MANSCLPLERVDQVEDGCRQQAQAAEQEQDVGGDVGKGFHAAVSGKISCPMRFAAISQ